MGMSVLAEQKVAVITGGASGIGLAVARRCVQRKMHVFIVDFDETALCNAEAELLQILTDGVGSVVQLSADVTDVVAVERVRDEVWHRCGGCHFLFLNAGIGGGGGPWTGLNKWRTLVDVNLFGVLHGLQAFVPAMLVTKEKGVIAITGSREGITTPPNDICYNVTKAGVRVLAEGLEHQLRSTSGCVLSSRLLLPGVTATPIAYNTTRRLKGTAAADARSASVGGGKERIMEAMTKGAAVAADTVAQLLLEAVERGDPFYVICPGSSSVEDFKRSYQEYADDLIQQRAPLSQFSKL